MHSRANQYFPLQFNGTKDDPVVYQALRRLTTTAAMEPAREETELAYFPPPDADGGWRALKDGGRVVSRAWKRRTLAVARKLHGR